MSAPKDRSRVEAIAKYLALEKQGIFDRDVEDDPPTIEILPGTVDYKQKKLKSRLMSIFAFSKARKFLNRMIATGGLRVKEVVGVENLDNLDSGAVITCNHFSPMDSFLTQIAYEKSSSSKKRKLFRIIREGNYTSFPGFYGYLMRNCNTLPLSSNMSTMKEFYEGVDYQLSKGNFVLIYPEESLWWMYRKPKPLKRGAYAFAAKSRVPVVPIFITWEDLDEIGEDGFPIPYYTIHVMKPIYPDDNENPSADSKRMMQENYEAWKKCYEETYGKMLIYDTEAK